MNLNIQKKFLLFIKKTNNVFYYFFFFLVLLLSLITYKTFIYQKNYQIKKEFKNIFNQIQKNRIQSINDMKNFLRKNKNIYGTLVGLNLAKFYDSKKKYSYALKTLFEVLEFTEDDNLKNLIKLRISILYIKKNKIILAKKMQSSMNQKNWKKVLNIYDNLY